MKSPPALHGFTGRESENPYALMHDLRSDEAERASRPRSNLSIAKTLFVWTLVCSLSAAPSFYFAISQMAKDQAAAMILGVIIFIAIYTLADLVSREFPARKNVHLRRIMRATFLVRSMMVVVFPLSLFTDLWLGMIAVGITTSLWRVFDREFLQNQMTFSMTLATTLLQGCLLSVLLLLLGLLIGVAAFVIRSLASRFR